MTEQFKCFDDYQIGDEGVTTPRTVGESDITTFACITGDYSRIHMDGHYASNTMYKGRIAHGLLGASLATGMLSLDAPHVMGRGNPQSYFYGFEVNYRGIIKLGDTIETKWHVAEKTADQRHEGFGVIKTDFQMVNQEGNPVYDGSIKTIVGRKDSPGSCEPPLGQAAPWKFPESISGPKRLCYAEDYTVDGEPGKTEGRTITESDIVNFAGFTGDYNPLHMDAEFAKKTMFGERIAHGMLSFNISFAYWLRDWLRKLSQYAGPKSDIAGHLSDRISFLAPVKIGDTLRCHYKTLSSRVSKTKPDFGLVTFGLQVINQKNKVVQEGSVLMMMPSSLQALS